MAALTISNGLKNFILDWGWDWDWDWDWDVAFYVKDFLVHTHGKMNIFKTSKKKKFLRVNNTSHK